MRVFLLTFVLFLLPLTGHAQKQCDSIDAPSINRVEDGDFWNFCDIHSRRLAYFSNHKSFREALDRRRENYVSGQISERQTYRLRLQTHYDHLK